MALVLSESVPTTRERVAVLLARGHDATEIAQRLRIRRQTVRYHIGEIVAIADGRERSGGHNRDPERAAEIARRRRTGEKLTDIATDLGITVSAASVMLKRYGYR